ncbi:META domain-containing protein [Flavobacterium polysaccharolyticum]|uniref:META domain-containing protein n=1 Tax=Flavobacterium polysaccharolyticum TaxID=3133148 RepID=A0ABU9NKI2_9FLAO
MKKVNLIVIFIALTLTACHATKNTTKSSNSLQGEWVLTYISGPRIAFEGLYPNQKPTINFDVTFKKVFGKNSCNNYSGMLNLDGSKISFKDSKMAVTMMACPGNGDSVYMDMLEKVDSFTISADGKELIMTRNGVRLLRFEKK